MTEGKPCERPAIREAVVVEGRDDEAAVLRAVEAAVISTHGWGLSEECVQRIRAACERQGVVILTDPDHAGEQIRKRLGELFPQARHAYLARTDAQKRRGEGVQDIGVENASPEAIRAALLAATAHQDEAEAGGASPEDIPGEEDLIALGLAGAAASAALRQAVGRELGIGSCNAKAFAKRLKAFGITREELLAAWRRHSPDNR